jgi:hypothetical protein
VFTQFHLGFPCDLGIGGMDEASRFQSESVHELGCIFFCFLLWLICDAIIFFIIGRNTGIINVVDHLGVLPSGREAGSHLKDLVRGTELCQM